MLFNSITTMLSITDDMQLGYVNYLMNLLITYHILLRIALHYLHNALLYNMYIIVNSIMYYNLSYVTFILYRA